MNDTVEEIEKSIRRAARKYHQKAEAYEKIADSIRSTNIEAAREIFRQLEEPK